MKIGTKSVLFGAHCFFLHPWFVAAAWWKLYGFPFDPRLWVAFFVHDLGYWGKPNMDGIEGERHPYFGARIMQRLFDKKERIWRLVDPHVTIPYNEPIEIWDGLRIKTARLVQGGFEEITDGTDPVNALDELFKSVRSKTIIHSHVKPDNDHNQIAGLGNDLFDILKGKKKPPNGFPFQ